MQKKLIVKAIALLGCVGLSHTAFAADDAPVERVVITGSNLKRAATETPSAVQVISKKEIQQTGAVSVADLMSKIPALGSSNQVDARDGGFSKGLATASLRGLGSASTLILINGRRMSPAAYADPNAGQSTQYDLNSIPLSALERVEILKDGGSAVYGSDAIAGVINFITKRNFKGGEIAAQASRNGDGNFGRSGVNGVVGFGDLDQDRYNAFLAFDLSQRDRTGIDEANAVKADEYRALNGRLSNYYSGVSGFPVFYKERTLGSGSYNTYAGANLGCNPSDVLTGSTALIPMRSNDPLIGNKFCNYDGWRKEDAEGKNRTVNLLSRGEFKINNDMSAFAEAAYSKTELEYSGVSRTMNGRNKVTVFPKDGAGTLFQPILGVNHPDNPTRGTATPVPVAVAYRFVDAPGGSTNENTSSRVLAGLKGTNFNFDWDTGVLYNETKRHQLSKGFLYLPIVQTLAANNVPLATIASTPGVTRNVTLDGKSSILQWDLKGATEFGSLGGGAMGLALGVEAKQEKMNIVPDPLSVNGEIVGIANTYSDAKRNVHSAFMELRTPFLKNFEMEFAGRYDKYQGFKSSFTPKVGAKWTVTPTLALRSTYSEGFRAPSLTQMVNGGTQYFLNNFEDKKRCDKPGAEAQDCLKSVSGIAASNPDLKPEKSKSFTAGLIFSPTSDFDILVDYYRIRKDAEVDLMSSIAVLQDPNLQYLVKRDQNQGTWLIGDDGKVIPNSGPLISIATPYINSGGTRTSGVDLELALRNNLGDMGKLSSRLNYTYVFNFKKAAANGDPMYDLVGTNGAVSNDTTSVGDLPRVRATLSSTWSFQKHNLTAILNYVAPISLMARYSTQEDGKVGPYEPAYCEFGRSANVPNYLNYYSHCEVPSWTTIDLAYSYTGIKNVTLGLNIQNLFDVSAPYDPNGVSSNQTAGYNSTLHNARGRYFTVKANYAF
ncbi:TonB-dependent receptor [Oxalobacteraceae bacterium]|nr:TonB-dependent receptor [Oxalobacteraceae bacterium]